MKCADLTAKQRMEQRRLLRAARLPLGRNGITDVGGLLMCNIHRRPLIVCVDMKEEEPTP